MNIMLASVLERTREIGIRRAVGARREDVRFQFIVESFAISAIGGLAGILMGLAIAAAVSVSAGWPTEVKAWSILLATGVAMGVGLTSGIYPAVRASNLDPIESFRYEQLQQVQDPESAPQLVGRLEEQQQPGRGVEQQVEPVDGSHQLAGEEHLQLFPQMGRRERGEPQGEAEDHEEDPGDLVEPGHGRSLYDRVSSVATKNIFGCPAILCSAGAVDLAMET